MKYFTYQPVSLAHCSHLEADKSDKSVAFQSHRERSVHTQNTFREFGDPH